MAKRPATMRALLSPGPGVGHRAPGRRRSHCRADSLPPTAERLSARIAGRAKTLCHRPEQHRPTNQPDVCRAWLWWKEQRVTAQVADKAIRPGNQPLSPDNWFEAGSRGRHRAGLPERSGRRRALLARISNLAALGRRWRYLPAREAAYQWQQGRWDSRWLPGFEGSRRDPDPDLYLPELGLAGPDFQIEPGSDRQ